MISKNSPHVNVRLGDPIVVAQGPFDVQNWGPYQFPALERLPDGRVHIRYHIEADSARAYGLVCGHAVSSDSGCTWEPVKNPAGKGRPYIRSVGLILPNGDRLAPVEQEALKVDRLELPVPFLVRNDGYSNSMRIFRAEDIRKDYRGWCFCRLPKGRKKWVMEYAEVNIPGETRYAVENVLVLPFLWRMRLAPDGSLWGIHYAYRIIDGEVSKSHAMFIRSTDAGRTWTFLSEIPYQPDSASDSFWDKREGFTEPDVAFLPDGSVMCLLRTTDGSGVGPLYVSYSSDLGKMWSKPAVFDNLGVWPDLLTLGNHVTLAVYGRPGLFLRATSDSSGRQWDERVTVVAHERTCSYASLLALDSNTALLAYTDFTRPDSQGRPCKTILVRSVTCRVE
jgi:hypothetical protein